MKYQTSKVLAFQIAALVAAMPGLMAETPEEKGLKIATESDKRDTGFGDTVVEMEMILTNRHGESSTRKMSLKTLEGVGDGDKTLITFDQPRDVKGTAFLSYTHKEGADDQWLYLPALKRVKRIASNNKSGPFVGSEFAYEDMTSQEVEKYTYKYLGDAELDGMDCFRIERYPVDPKSGYTRQVGWVDKEHYRVIKIDFYDRKDSLLKTLTFNGYQRYLDKFWRSESMKMVNHQTGKSTELLWKNYVFGNGYTERDFDQRSLQRAR
ncbi:MAG: outer membrane lipoprotein-sorting protein [Opitutales bacterium TMED158]|nr:MAG: outer membrane lipoprotein-sorting protein [Opitutales bacterium TMED158]